MRGALGNAMLSATCFNRRTMWIETDTYIGPCRRQGRKLRLFNRRRGDDASRDPSVASLIRQLRANAQDLTDDVKRRRFKLRLTATIGLARQNRFRKTAEILEQLDRQAPEQALTDPRALILIERALTAAAEALPSGS